MKIATPFLPVVLMSALLLVHSPPSLAKSVGFEHDGLPGCTSAEDMGIASVTSGSTESFDLVFYDVPMQIYAVGCMICFQDSTMVDPGTVSFSFNVPPEWTTTGIRPTPHDITIDPDIFVAYPRAKCWEISATDFTVSAPYTLELYGTMTFTTARDGCLGLVIDGSGPDWNPHGVAVLYTDFTSDRFDGEGETCDPFVCPGSTATGDETWGGIKTLFR